MKFPDIKVDEKGLKDGGTADFETAIELTQFGRFHLFLIFVGGFCFLATGFEYGLHAYILPFAQCDLKITATQMGIINAMFLGGGITCSFFWGVVADTVGRRKVLLISMFIDGLSTILASWSTSYLMFAVVRFVSGFMCGAPGCLVNSYVGEFCADKHRSRGICLIGFCWTLAWMLLPGVAWLVIPSNLGFYTTFMDYQSWRVFVALIGLPNLIASILLYFLPETPKFLYIQGKETEAMEVLKMMFHKNTGRPKEEYPGDNTGNTILKFLSHSKVVNLVATYNGNSNADSIKTAAIEDSDKKVVKSKSFMEVCGMMFHQTKQVFVPPHIGRTVLSSSIYFTNMFGYYGLGLWLPELFNRFEAFYAQNPDKSISVCELSQLNNYPDDSDSFLSDESTLDKILSDCGERTINLGVFSNTFIIGAVCCVGNILAVILSNKVGGRILSVVSTLMSGVCAILVNFLQSEKEIVIVNCLFMMGVGTAMITISSCIVNIFPTSIRGMGVCIGILFGRVGAVTSNLVFGMLLDISCEIPIFLLGGTVIFGGLLCLLLPKNSLQATE